MIYEAQLCIMCVDGALEVCESREPERLLKFLKQRDHEGSSVYMTVRDTPDSVFRNVDDPEQVYKELESYCDPQEDL